MKEERDCLDVLVLGMGASAFGRERRAVSTFKHMSRVKPFFLISQWGDGSVGHLLKENQINFGCAPFGYLGFVEPRWTLITIFHLPRLSSEILRTYEKNRCKAIVLLCFHPLMNAFLPLLYLKFFRQAKLFFYLGDIPKRDGLNRILARCINQLSSRVIANSLAVKKGLGKLGLREDKIKVIYNGVDRHKFDEAVVQNLKKEFGWPAESILVGFVGQISENKGVSDFIEAAKIVCQNDSHCRFLIISRPSEGNGLPSPFYELIHAPALDDRIVFAGWKDEMEQVYKTLDIVVVPSRHEDPAPNVNIEAMAAGVPVVATRVGGSPELVQDGVTGFLVERQNIEEIAARVLELIRRPELRQAMSKAARQRVVEKFDIQKNAALIEKILLNE